MTCVGPPDRTRAPSLYLRFSRGTFHLDDVRIKEGQRGPGAKESRDTGPGMPPHASWTRGTGAALGEVAAVLQPIRQALRPASHGYEARTVAHVEGVFAARQKVRLHRHVGGVQLGVQLERRVVAAVF